MLLATLNEDDHSIIRRVRVLKQTTHLRLASQYLKAGQSQEVKRRLFAICNRTQYRLNIHRVYVIALANWHYPMMLGSDNTDC